MLQTSNIRLAFLCFAFLAHSGFYVADARSSVKNEAARKFDELSRSVVPWQEEEARGARFAQQLKREPRTKACLIAYSPRIHNRVGSSHGDIAANHLLATKAHLTNRLGINEERIITIDGGIREAATIEFWILPPGAQTPQARPEFQPSEIVRCCNLQVRGAMYVFRKDTPLNFTVSEAWNPCPQATSYRWSISSGEIVKGQGTDTITVDAGAMTDKYVKATVDAEGLSPECINRADSTTVVGVAPYKLSEFQENFSEALKIWGDYLGLILQQNPELRGHLIVYAARNSDPKRAAVRLDWARNYLINSRGIPPQHLTTLVGGYREHLIFEYWLVPQGMPAPPPTPTVDERYARPRSRTQNGRRRRPTN